MVITRFGLWMHQVNQQLEQQGVRIIDIIVDTQQKPYVEMIHLSRHAKGIVRYAGNRELEFELYDKRTNKLLKWSMISNIHPAHIEALEEFLAPYFKGLRTGEVESIEWLLKNA